MAEVERITSEDAELDLSVVRDGQSDIEAVRKSLHRLGALAGLRVARRWLSRGQTVTTPMGREYGGIFREAVNVCVVSTSDEYEVFGAGVASCFLGCLRGHLDLQGRRGPDALKGPVTSFQLPPKHGEVDAVVVAKSVLATGCTAIKLLGAAQAEYTPKRLIIATVFHSEQGIREVTDAYPHLSIVAYGPPDALGADGMLLPGVGNLDERIRRDSPHRAGLRERLVRSLAYLLGVDVNVDNM